MNSAPQRIGVPRESLPQETRVAATPRTVQQLISLGYSVQVERGAGARAAYLDNAYVGAGATIVGDDVWNADLLLKVNAPSADEVPLLQPGQYLASLLAPALNPELVESIAARGATALAMDAVPRISRAQALDVLSSMANIGGYRAVVEAAHEFGSFFTGQVTAAGKVPPAKVLVVGAGVAGLAAIGTAGSLGAVVRAFDSRPETAEQVESMGAEFLRVDVDEGTDEPGPSADGYAKETGAQFNRLAEQLYAAQSRDVDIIITTALIPGKPAPRLITEEMVASMRPGSVIVDMAAASGGNVAGSRADELVVTEGGVKIIGYTDLPGRLPTQASQLFGTNLVNLVKLLTPGQDGRLALDLDDIVLRGMTVCRSGEVLWPPPAVQVSAAPVAHPAAAAQAVAEPPAAPSKYRTPGLLIGAIALILGMGLVVPSAFLAHFTVFLLAVVVGYYVIGKVRHSLHTPLMSVTNAVSGIVVIGALLQLGSSDPTTRAIALAAVTLASINVFGGFTVTARMLNMFRKA
ncbi:Re/Si-specific NAD(P)(+) transhydrogenase subunit alpha [Flexivirga alba]|uniref:proton-translocating NAD(P)(+) transhydrogenase n=1 Tax=Flexivirga alba TaxID=702742 RepID=A0ABW2AK46_9MICO